MTYRWLSTTTVLKSHHVSKPRDLRRRQDVGSLHVRIFLSSPIGNHLPRLLAEVCLTGEACATFNAQTYSVSIKLSLLIIIYLLPCTDRTTDYNSISFFFLARLGYRAYPNQRFVRFGLNIICGMPIHTADTYLLLMILKKNRRAEEVGGGNPAFCIYARVWVSYPTQSFLPIILIDRRA